MKPPPPKPAQKFQVLVVEDDIGRAHVLISSLTELNMECRHASNGGAGLKLFREKLPHLVMTDVMMPGIDGFELCQQVRSESTIPILLMNENVTDDHQMKALKLGADAYLDKNMTAQVMAAHVIAWLRRVYHYDKPDIPFIGEVNSKPARPGSLPPSEAARAQAGMPAGWVKCDGCSYMGPRQKFESEGMLDVGGLTCPVCHQRDQIVYDMS